MNKKKKIWEMQNKRLRERKRKKSDKGYLPSITDTQKKKGWRRWTMHIHSMCGQKHFKITLFPSWLKIFPLLCRNLQLSWNTADLRKVICLSDYDWKKALHYLLKIHHRHYYEECFFPHFYQSLYLHHKENIFSLTGLWTWECYNVTMFPLQNLHTEGFIEGYSRIQGWAMKTSKLKV